MRKSSDPIQLSSKTPEKTLRRTRNRGVALSVAEIRIVAMEERDPAISQAKKRRKIIASLLKLFNMIHVLLPEWSVITKEELVSKIISSHSDIVDRSEVEEQLNLLLELVPDWISEKLALGGDFLICINKISNPETIRATLEEALLEEAK